MAEKDEFDQREFDFETLSDNELVDLLCEFFPLVANSYYQQPVIPTKLIRKLYLGQSQSDEEGAALLHELFSSEKRRFPAELIDFLTQEISLGSKLKGRVTFYEDEERDAYILRIFPVANDYQHFVSLQIDKDGLITSSSREARGNRVKEDYTYDDSGNLIEIKYWQRVAIHDYKEMTDSIGLDREQGNSDTQGTVVLINRVIAKGFLHAPQLEIRSRSFAVGEHPIHPSHPGVTDVEEEILYKDEDVVILTEQELRSLLLEKVFDGQSDGVSELIDAIKKLPPGVVRLKFKNALLQIAFVDDKFSISLDQKSQEVLEILRKHSSEAQRKQITISLIPEQIEGNRYQFNIFNALLEGANLSLTDEERTVIIDQIRIIIGQSLSIRVFNKKPLINLRSGIGFAIKLPVMHEDGMNLEIDDNGNISNTTPYLRDTDNKWETVEVIIVREGEN